jgi:FlaG/FlaF family flagellin (archaellin)
MRTRSTVGSDNRAVSDVVGYVLIFSLITLSVGVITVGGFSTLEDRQDAERINNAERAFDVFAANMEDVYRDGAPSRATEMRLSGGTLRYGEPVNITVADTDSPDTNATIQTTPLVYADGGTEIIYVAGAIIRNEGDSAVMIRDPPFRFGPDQRLVPLVQTIDFPGVTTISADGTVRIRTISVERTATPDPGLSEADEIQIDVTTPRTDVWERYFEQQQTEIGGSVSADDDKVRYTLEKKTLSTPQFRIQIRL